MRNKLYLFLTLFIMSLASCGSDNDDNKSGNSNTDNVNANTIGNVSETKTRLEFPHLASSDNIILVHKDANGEVNYSTEWDYVKKSQRWSCYEMYKSLSEKNVQRYYPTNGDLQYPFDPLLDKFPLVYYFNDNGAKSDPFWSTGYDHGHICPSADRLSSSELNTQTFYLTNMQPQLNSFNAAVWANMETAVRNLVTKNNYGFLDTLYVCKGGTIGTEGGTVSAADQVLTKTDKGLIVPKYFFCALLMVKNGSYYAIGLWFEHKADSTKSMKNYVVTIDELEARTGIDFFCNLPDNIEDKVETQNIPSLWGFN